MVSAVVTHLVLFGGFGEEEGTPICYATNHATLGEDEVSCCASDSRGGEDISIGCPGVEAVPMARSWRTL